MSAVDFFNHAQAEAWFEKQTPERRCVITSRGALRVLAAIGQFAGDGKERLALTALRATLISAGRGLGRPADVGVLDSAARSAVSGVSAVFSARSAVSAVSSVFSAQSALSAARSAVSAVFSAQSAFSAARPSALLAFSSDTEKTNDALLALPVWQAAEVPPSLADAHVVWLDYLGSHPDWAFWLRWYSEMWEGTFRDWDLAVQVALIPDEFWEGDDALGRVAREIEKISDRFRTSITVPIIRNNNDTAFRLKDESPLPDEVLDYIKERVGGALDTALADGGANGFDAECPEAMAIRRALTSRNPSAVAGLLNDASLMFQKNLGNRYPDDGSLIALQAAAFSGAEEICETDELARARCLRASKLFLRDNPPPLDHKDMEQFVDEVTAEAEGEAAEIIRQDGEAIASGRAVGRFIRARFANYTSTIVQWIDRTKKGEGRVNWLWKQVKRIMDAFEDTPPDA